MKKAVQPKGESMALAKAITVKVPQKSISVVDPTAYKLIPGGDGFPDTHALQWVDLDPTFEYIAQSASNLQPSIWKDRTHLPKKPKAWTFSQMFPAEVAPGLELEVYRLVVVLN